MLTEILIGPITRDKAESVGMINEAFIAGLGSRYRFIPHLATRPAGNVAPAQFNLANIYYLFIHLGRWLTPLVWSRPKIAHYGITSRWNCVKSLFLLRLAKLFGLKTLGHLHGGGFLDFWRELPQWRQRLIRSQLRGLDCVVVLSSYWRDVMIAEIGVAPSHVRIVNNPIDETFEGMALAMPVARPGFTVLCFGVMDRLKGVFDIVEAAAMLPPTAGIKIQLAGPDRVPGLTAEVADTIRARGLSDRIEIVGPVFGNAKVALFAKACVLLQPSYVENLPLTVLEAAAAGLPIVTTPVGAVPEFFAHETSCLFVQPKSPHEIANALLRLQASSTERHALGAAARGVFTAGFSRQRIMTSMEEVYASLLPGTRSEIRRTPGSDMKGSTT